MNSDCYSIKFKNLFRENWQANILYYYAQDLFLQKTSFSMLPHGDLSDQTIALASVNSIPGYAMPIYKLRLKK